jgi:hypothetical protein
LLAGVPYPNNPFTKTVAVAIAFAAASIARADCPSPKPEAAQTIDPLADRPYANESQAKRPCPDNNGDIIEAPISETRRLGVALTGSGGAILAVGGVLWGGWAATSDPGSKQVVLDVAIVVSALGTALLVAGLVVVMRDSSAAPVVALAPSGHGAQVLWTGRF